MELFQSVVLLGIAVLGLVCQKQLYDHIKWHKEQKWR